MVRFEKSPSTLKENHIVQEENFVIPAGLLQAVIDYLAARPYKEVAGALPQLLNLKPQPVAEEPVAEEPEG